MKVGNSHSVLISRFAEALGYTRVQTNKELHPHHEGHERKSGSRCIAVKLCHTSDEI